MAGNMYLTASVHHVDSQPLTGKLPKDVITLRLSVRLAEVVHVMEVVERTWSAWFGHDIPCFFVSEKGVKMGNLRTSSRKYKEGDYVVYILRDFIGYQPIVCKVVKDLGESVRCETLVSGVSVQPPKAMLTLIPCAFWSDTYKPDRGDLAKPKAKRRIPSEKRKSLRKNE